MENKTLLKTIILIVTCIFSQFILGEESKNVKSVTLTKVLEINDDSGEFILAYPSHFQVAPDNTLFMMDKNALYQFDSKGKFIRDFLKRGEGPGEIKYFANFYFTDKHLMMNGANPFTLQKKSLADASLVDEFRDSRLNAVSVLFGDRRGAWLRFRNVQYGKKERGYKTGIKPYTHQIFFMNPNKKVTDIKLLFTTEMASYMFKTESGNIMARDFPITSFINAWDGNRYWYIFHTRRYLIKQVDLRNNKVIREIKCPYTPVEYVTPKNEDKWKMKLYDHYKRQYHNDIVALKIYKNKLLVFTSTFNKRGDIMVHMYNSQGKLIDTFHLHMPRVKTPGRWARTSFNIIQNHMWASHTDEDDNTVVVKYKFRL